MNLSTTACALAHSSWMAVVIGSFINLFLFSLSLLGTNRSPPAPVYSKAGKHLNSSSCMSATFCKLHLYYLLTQQKQSSFHIMHTRMGAHVQTWPSRLRPDEFLSYNEGGNIALRTTRSHKYSKSWIRAEL